ncbi:unnamed protein product [Lactuca saligna]|uniref:Uncharacterized protein n=1 Tax=Lactuca saligna TaxID=75948 RepID=A0AA35ZJK6_LACSI|nr:unnamed protein product [Lactuca saligna]
MLDQSFTRISVTILKISSGNHLTNNNSMGNPKSPKQRANTIRSLGSQANTIVVTPISFYLQKNELEGNSLGTSMQFDTFGFTVAEVARKQVEKGKNERCLIDAEIGMASWSLNKEFKNWFTFWMVRWVSLLMMLRRTACASSYHQKQPLINQHVPLRVTIEAMAKAFGVTVDFIDLGKQGAVTIHCSREASLQDQQSSRCFGNQPPRCKECSLSNLSIVIL